jgi:hypothetical protein
MWQLLLAAQVWFVLFTIHECPLWFQHIIGALQLARVVPVLMGATAAGAGCTCVTCD